VFSNPEEGTAVTRIGIIQIVYDISSLSAIDVVTTAFSNAKTKDNLVRIATKHSVAQR
jgi:hypothetical protein